MFKLLSILLAIIFNAPSSLHANDFSEPELSIAKDSGIPVIEVPLNWRTQWLKGDRSTRDIQDKVKSTNEHPRSLLLSTLTGDLRGFEEPGYPGREPWEQYESLTQSDHQKREEHEEQKGENYEEDEEDEGRKKYEEYLKRQEEESEKPKVNLFGPPRSQLRENMEQFYQQNPRRVQFESRDLLQTLQHASNVKDSETPRVRRSEFSYTHPEEWSVASPECSGRLQSPVNLETDQLVRLDVPSSLTWTGYRNEPQSLTIVDNGHSVQLSGTWDKKTTPFISGGPLTGDYLFAQLHFHWGPSDSVGSEHTINNNSFPMEMHMVHYKREYGSFEGALQHDDGLAVIAFFYEISEKSNFGINLLEDSLKKIKNKPRVPIPVKPYLLGFLHVTFQEDYAAYIGSLTTPPCREIVTWLVSSSPLVVSQKQLESFREISSKWPENENYRPPQALNGRRLYYVEH